MYYQYMVWILFVDDEPLVARAMQRVIAGKLGLRVRCAHGPGDLKARLAEEATAPDAVVLDHDLGLARVDGVQVLLELRRIAPGARYAFFTAAPPAVIEAALRAARVTEPIPCFSKPGPAGPLLEWLQGVHRR